MKERILIVDDDQDQCDLLGAVVGRLDYAVTTTTSPTEALNLAASSPFDAILTDLGMSTMSGTELCSRIMASRPDVPVIVVTGLGSLESAIAAMRAGAYDFLNKPVDVNVLGMTLQRAVQHRQLREEVKRLREQVPDPRVAGSMIGESGAMKGVVDLITRVGPTEASVLIHGETGTGKELVARAVHAAGPRGSGPFVAINCAAVPASLLESELFGHARGAFTDAKMARDGLFVRASGGTLFLDEVGEMPLEMQAKLLRALQERTVRPVGSNTEMPFDTRIVTATHRDLEAEVASQRFREDLYYRINVVKIPVPPLRERGSDILVLATHFLRKAAERSRRAEIEMKMPPQFASLLLAYDWPGNVRELENCMERAVALARFDHVSAEDLPERVRAFKADKIKLVAEQSNEILTLDELERRYILRALRIVGGNRSRAAELLGLDRRTLYRRIEKYQRTSPDESPGAGGPPQASAGN
ncbi:MAG TPA: sigma-54 dependent transcriptional regulator [Polyangiaceae bacterium]